MKLSKKWLAIGGVVLALVIAASIGGIAVMADNSGSTASATTTTTTTPPTTTTSAEQTFLDKVAAIYQQNTGTALNETALQNAITQARTEMHTAALQTRLQDMVSAGTLTQDQANQILSWWESMPSVLSGGGLGLLHGGPGFMRGMP